MVNKRTTGMEYENVAAEYLETVGYEILERNFRCRQGEIDLVAKDGEYLVFVEVKYRGSSRNGNPFEAITMKKQKTISQCAMQYLIKNELLDFPVRFDVVGILKNEIKLIKNAFDFMN